MRTLLLLVAMIVVGCVTLPLSAALLDGSETGEDLVLPVQVLITTALGAALGAALLGPEGSARRRALTGAVLGLLGALAGILVFFVVLNGFDGA